MSIIQAFRRQGVVTYVTFPGLDVTNGNFITGATWTITCDGVAINAAPDLGDTVDVTGTPGAGDITEVLEIGTTGVYNLLIQPSNNAAEKTIFKLDPNTANVESVLVILDTALYCSHINVTSATATQPAVSLLGNTTGAGISSTGGATGNGMNLVGGATGVGANISSPGGDGMIIAGAGSGKYGLSISSGSSNGMYVTGGTRGAYFVGAGASSPGIEIAGTGVTASTGLLISGTGSGHGISSTGGATGAGAIISGGASSGSGLTCTGPNGHGATFTGGAGSDTAGISITGGGSGTIGSLNISTRTSTAAPAVNIQPGTTTTGVGVIIKGGTGATGDALQLTSVSTNGNALKLTATGTGVELLGSGNAQLGSLPGDTPTLLQMIQFLYEYAAYKLTTTATTATLYKANSTDALGAATLADDGTTFSRAKIA